MKKDDQRGLKERLLSDAAALATVACDCFTGLPFDFFAAEMRLSLQDARRFYDYVLKCGGGAGR